MTTHGEHCIRPYSRECLEFSTDGTRLGAEIAHTMGTTDEEEIIQMGLSGDKRFHLTGMLDEQADWESDDE